MNERLLDVKEVSQILSISVWQCYRMALRNEIPSIKINKLRRFRKSDLMEWIKKQTISQT